MSVNIEKVRETVGKRKKGVWVFVMDDPPPQGMTDIPFILKRDILQMADEIETLREIVGDVVQEIFLSTPIDDVHWAQIRERIEPFLPESPPHDAMQVELEDAAREDELERLRSENAELKKLRDEVGRFIEVFGSARGQAVTPYDISHSNLVIAYKQSGGKDNEIV